ncbi:L,D-transpeptidase [Aneurinibacillus sp. BA2021]|nr:L,D-transpeptidase [Aneurinibacillus sp. BA2021]
MAHLIRILSIFFVFFYFQFFPQQPAEAPSRMPEPFYEVIGVPNGHTPKQLRAQLDSYIKRSGYTAESTPVIVGVPQLASLPAYTPLPFYQPDFLTYVMDPTGNVRFFDLSCICEDNAEMTYIKQKIARQRLQLEQLLLIRSALYHYYTANKTLPEKLDGLAAAFPYNYVSRIPFAASAHGTAAPTLSDADVIYRPEHFRPGDPWQSMRDVLYIDRAVEQTPRLQPVTIVIYQSSFRMMVQSGPYTIRSYRIGLGAEQRTPTGTYTIKQKVSNPVSESRVYGTRGLVLDDTAYAIHGTNDLNSIGKAVSKGCIRLANPDVEELFSMVPLGTKVSIQAGAAPGLQQPNAPPFLLAPRINEENPHHVYHWKQ